LAVARIYGGVVSLSACRGFRQILIGPLLSIARCQSSSITTGMLLEGTLGKPLVFSRKDVGHVYVCFDVVETLTFPALATFLYAYAGSTSVKVLRQLNPLVLDPKMALN